PAPRHGPPRSANIRAPGFVPRLRAPLQWIGPGVAASAAHRGMHITDEQRGADMADETYAGESYCGKCRERREAEGNVVVSNGRRMAEAVCRECGTKLNGILGEAWRPPARSPGPRSDEEARGRVVQGLLVVSSGARGHRFTRPPAAGSCGGGRGRA